MECSKGDCRLPSPKTLNLSLPIRFRYTEADFDILMDFQLKQRLGTIINIETSKYKN